LKPLNGARITNPFFIFEEGFLFSLQRSDHQACPYAQAPLPLLGSDNKLLIGRRGKLTQAPGQFLDETFLLMREKFA
jgi:hypothetical protein